MKASQVWIKTLYRSNGGIEEVMNRSDRESMEGVWKAQKIWEKRDNHVIGMSVGKLQLYAGYNLLLLGIYCIYAIRVLHQ